MEKKYLLKKDKVKELCLKNNVNFTELADLLGMCQSVFSYKLNGQRSCSEEEITNLSCIFNVPIYDFCTYYCRISDKDIQKTAEFMKGKVFCGERFKSALKEQGLSKAKFSKIIDSSDTSFDRWCGHYGNPKPNVAIRISQYLDIPLSSLFEDGDTIAYGSKEQIHNKPDKAKTDREPMSLCDKDIAKIETDDTTENTRICEEDTAPLLNLQSFEEGNVLDNLRVINENLIMISSFVSTEVRSMFDQLSILKSQIGSINESLQILENEMQSFKSLQSDTKSKPKATLILPQFLSDNDVLSICKDNCRADDYSSYKDKIQKLLAFISKKKGLVYNQTARDFYLEFERVYGMSLNSMRKGYTKDTKTLNIIYDDPATREIFFNIVATEASHLAGDQIILH